MNGFGALRQHSCMKRWSCTKARGTLPAAFLNDPLQGTNNHSEVFPDCPPRGRHATKDIATSRVWGTLANESAEIAGTFKVSSGSGQHTNRIVKGPFRRRDRSYSPNTVMVHKLLFFLIDLLSPYQASSPALVPLCAALDQAGNRLLDLLVRQTCALLAPGSPNWISRKSLLTLQGLALLNTELCIAQQHPSAIPSSFGDPVEGAVLTVSRVNLG